MAFNSHTTGSDRRHALTAAAPLLIGFARNAAAKARGVVKTLQTARMMSTLSNMRDDQLAEMGLLRSDIPDYAEKLMAED